MCCWPKEDPVYDKSKSRAENYLYLRGLFEAEASEEKNINISPAKHYKYILTHRQYKGAHTEINYTESLRDLIEAGVVKIPIMNFDVIFVEWASGYLDKADLTYKTSKALYDFDYSGRDSKQGLEFDSIEWYKLQDKTACLHRYKNFPEEEFVLSPVVKQDSSEQVAAMYGGNQFVAPRPTQQVVQTPVQSQDVITIPYIDNPPTDWANNRRFAEIENQMALNSERRRKMREMTPQVTYGSNLEDLNFISWQKREHTAFWVTGIAE
ncbi:MAG: hypothetical protein J5497_07130 [Selenomonadaceae bacterium]|nr:hypothetical protein [Selenomonadaceae bacterium]